MKIDLECGEDSGGSLVFRFALSGMTEPLYVFNGIRRQGDDDSLASTTKAFTLLEGNELVVYQGIPPVPEGMQVSVLYRPLATFIGPNGKLEASIRVHQPVHLSMYYPSKLGILKKLGGALHLSPRGDVQSVRLRLGFVPATGLTAVPVLGGVEGLVRVSPASLVVERHVTIDSRSVAVPRPVVWVQD